MILRISLVKLLAAFLCVASAAAADPAPAFDTVSVDVSLSPDFTTGVLTGTERFQLRSLSDGLDTISVTVNPLAVDATLDGGDGVAVSIDGNRRVFHLPRRLAKGETATLVLRFSGTPKRDVVFTPDEIHTGYFTCEAMICDVDRPGDRAPLRFALTLPAGFDAVAPGHLVSRVAAGAGQEIWRWREDRAYPAYLYGFAAGRYARAMLSPSLAVLYKGETPEHVQAVFAGTARMIAFYESKAGLPLPEGRYTQVLVAANGDQEDAALAMIEKGSVDGGDPQDDGMIAHELAHQWWGNLVTCAEWRELWLNEGMAGFMTAAWKAQRWGRAAYDREIAVAQRAWGAAKTAGLDEPLSWGGTYPTLRDKRRIAYGKSMVFLDTLRTTLGDDAFWRGVRRYTRDNAGRSVTATDMQKAFEAASGRDLSALFKTWVFGDGASVTTAK
jgi:aminopeptidase N